MIDVVALGELLIDFAAKSADAGGYPTMAANPGGAPGNFLAALGVYGCKTAFIGKVGADTFGKTAAPDDAACRNRNKGHCRRPRGLHDAGLRYL